MGIGSRIRKAVKKVGKGISSVFKSVKKIGSEVAKGLRSAGREVKRFAKSDLGKVVIAAALVYAGGAAYLAANSGGTITFTQALMSPSQVVGQLSGAGAVTESGASVAAESGAVEATLTGADSAASIASSTNMAGGASGGTISTAAPSTSSIASSGSQAANMAGASVGNGVAPAVASGAPAAAPISNLEAAIRAGGSQWSGAGSAPVTAGITESAAATGGGWLSNPIVQYGALQVGGNALSGLASAGSEEEAIKEAAKAREAERQAIIDGNVVPSIAPGAISGLNYDPVTGQESAINPTSTMQPYMRQQSALTPNPYATQQQGLLTMGGS